MTAPNPSSPLRPSTAGHSTDDAIRRAREAAEAGRKIDEDIKKTSAKSIFRRIGNGLRDMKVLAQAAYGIRVGAGWINEKILQPIANLPYIGPIISSPVVNICKAYYVFTHPYEGESMWQSTKNILTNPFRRLGNSMMNTVRKEEKPFAPDLRKRGGISPHRAGIAALMSAWALTGALNTPIAGDSFKYIVMEPAVDVTRMVATSIFNGVAGHGFGLTHETVYLGVPTKEPGDDIYHINGSTQLNGNDDNGVSFVVQDGLVHEIWSWAHLKGPFQPELVAGTVKPNVNMCEVESYGSRLKIARWASIKPTLLSISCQAPTELAAPHTPGHP